MKIKILYTEAVKKQDLDDANKQEQPWYIRYTDISNFQILTSYVAIIVSLMIHVWYRQAGPLHKQWGDLASSDCIIPGIQLFWWQFNVFCFLCVFGQHSYFCFNKWLAYLMSYMTWPKSLNLSASYPFWKQWTTSDGLFRKCPQILFTSQLTENKMC